MPNDRDPRITWPAIHFGLLAFFGAGSIAARTNGTVERGGIVEGGDHALVFAAQWAAGGGCGGGGIGGAGGTAVVVVSAVLTH